MNFIRKNNRYLFLVLFLISVFFVFKNLFISGPLVFGDAPYFHNEMFSELLAPLPSWIARGNSFGKANDFMWIYPLMWVYGALSHFFTFNNDIIVRILFYFPSLIFGVLGSQLLGSRLKLSKTVAVFVSFFYIFNTYYLMLVDGGQIGVVLSYGLFPFVAYCFLRYLDCPNTKNFWILFVSSVVLTIVDFRIFGICVLFSLLLNGIKNLRYLIPFFLLMVGVNTYWIWPALKLLHGPSVSGISQLQLISLLDTLFVFQPNFPVNQFGKVVPPPFYFVGIPILILSALFFLKKERKTLYLGLIFLFFVYLGKGESYPLGYIYAFFLNKIPFASVFRDSTKFYIPLLLLSGILIGRTLEYIKSKVLIFLVYIYVLFLIFPGVTGQLNGVLGKIPNISEFETVKNLLVNDNNFFRSVWFTEHSPFAFHLEDKQAIDGKDLANFRPFASLNVGTGDKFNFINHPIYSQMFDVLGIKYLVFSGNPRQGVVDKSAREDWSRLINLVSHDKNLNKLNIATGFPVFETKTTKPHIFTVDKLFLVIGADDIYQKILAKDSTFSIGNQSFLFAEDGKFSPQYLMEIPKESLGIIMNDKTEIDLSMSFLQKYFTNVVNFQYSQWAIRSASDYLTWKYELLQNNISTSEFDYNLGIAFSSEANEKLIFKVTFPNDGEYVFAVRSMSNNKTSSLSLTLDNNKNFEILNSKEGNFEWFVTKPLTITKGDHTLVFTNKNGFHVLNTFAFIPLESYTNATYVSDQFIKKFGIMNETKVPITQKTLASAWHKVNYKTIDNQTYSVSDIPENSWLIFSDRFDSNWQVDGHTSYPFYSMINGYFIGDKQDITLIYQGQKYVNQGIIISLIALCIALITSVVLLLYKYVRSS